MMDAVPAPLTGVTMPQLTFHSKPSTPVPVSGMSTMPSGEPFCHADEGAVVSIPVVAKGPRPAPQKLGAAEAEAGATSSARASVARTMRIRGFTPR